MDIGHYLTQGYPGLLLFLAFMCEVLRLRLHLNIAQGSVVAERLMRPLRWTSAVLVVVVFVWIVGAWFLREV